MSEETKNPVTEQDNKTEQPTNLPAPKVDITEVTEFLNPTIWGQMKAMSQAFVKSGALPKSENDFTILMKIQAGYEMGMKPLEAVKSFYFVNGTMNIFGSATMRRIREHGWRISYKDEPNKCTVTVSKGDESYTDSLTFEEAEKSGWTKSQYGLKPAWVDGVNRRLKLRYGATSILIKTYIPEVLGSATDIAEVAMDYDLEPRADVSTTVPNGDEPATPKQIETLKTMGYTDEDLEGLTVKTAVKLLTSKKKEESNE